MDDPKLTELLKEWRVSNAPASLEALILGERKPWWSFFTGSIRIPVPVAFAIVALLVLLAVAVIRRHVPPPVAAGPIDLADFRPVKDLNVRVIRGNGYAK